MAGVNPVVVEWKRSLGLACAAGDDDKVKSLLSDNAIDKKIRQGGIQLAIERATSTKSGKQSIALFLLREFKAATLLSEAAFRGILHRVVDINDAEVLQELLRGKSRTDLEYKDKKSQLRTPLFLAALKGHLETLQVLLESHADVDAKAAKDQTALIYLVAENGPETSQALRTVKWLLHSGADWAAKDSDQKNALHWTAITGKVEMTKMLLEAKADVNATSDRGRTALHYAAGGECTDGTIIDMLLAAGAKPTQTSDGGWTPLHNAAQRGNLKAVESLLNAGADLNATLSSRVTPLHWAAANGHEQIVRFFLSKKTVQKHKKDAFGSTPMIRAAQNGHREIAKLFHPSNDWANLSDEQKEVCKCHTFRATVVDFDRTLGYGQGPPESRVKKISIWDLLYGEDFSVSPNSYASESKKKSKLKGKSKDTTREHEKKFRWIHLPANNMAWTEALFNKLFIEEEASHVDNFKALQKTLGYQHRGRHVHSTFMIPHCSHTRPTVSGASWVSDNSSLAEKSEPVMPSPRSKDGKQRRARVHVKRDLERTKTERLKMRRESTISTLSSLRNDNAAGNAPNDSDDDSIDMRDEESQPRHGNIALFMPYLHFESHKRRVHMTATIKATKAGEAPHNVEQQFHDDIMLVRAYLDSSPSLHPRRTLDQFLYHSFDTEKRDIDQVVYRYFQRTLKRPEKIYMVDQLWLWIWGDDLIVTSFPQRWGQSELKNDPLCVLEGVIEDINSKTRPPVRSVHDLAMIITGRCSGGFDRHKVGEQEYQFMDMFDSSIGDLSVREPELFEKFEKASSAAATWLWEQEGRKETNKGPSLHFVNDLLDIKEETKLLKELKDIRDELNIIKSIFTHQRKVLKQFEEAVCEEPNEDKTDAERRFREQNRLIKLHLEDVERMDHQAQAIFTSLTQLLDFKQKHANAIEARFAREQAEVTAKQAEATSTQAKLTARQGETIMVFTIVTIFFLPMSFIAAFFTINVADFPRLSLGYVSQYVFGIGLSISLVLITIAFQVDHIRQLWSRRKAKPTEKLQRLPEIDPTNMKTVEVTPAVARLQQENSGGFEPPPRVFSGLSQLTGRSAYSRYSRDPEWGH